MIAAAIPEMPRPSRPAYSKELPPAPLQSGWKALSVFSGCGGLDLGFLQQGFLATRASDNDLSALRTYVRNLADVAVREDLAVAVPHVQADVLLAGAPCQGFSTAGKRDLADPRNALLMRVADIALANSSKVVIVENVPAALSGSHGRLWRALEDRLRWNGYNVRRLVIDGTQCGLAQKRKRLFLLAWKGSDCISFRLPTGTGLTVEEALVDVQADDRVDWPKVGSREWKIVRRIGPGQKLSNVRLSERAVPTWEIPEVFGRVTKAEKEVLRAVAKLRRRNRIRNYGDGDPVSRSRVQKELGRGVADEFARLVNAGFLRFVGRSVELTHTYNGRYRRLDWGRPSPTVDTRFGRIDLFVHPAEDRGITVNEASRLQGFPDYFVFEGGRKEIMTQIGNAVPPPMAAALAKVVREAILKA